MRRRQFITLIGVAAALPLAARAQQTAKIPTIGFMSVSTPKAWGHFVAAFEQRLAELNWINGRTVAIEYRWAEGRSERFVEISAELVRLKVDVILTGGSARCWPQSGRRKPFRSSSRWPTIRSAPAWSQVCRDQAAT
jgi:putative ABC transport system substrate-binding protein